MRFMLNVNIHFLSDFLSIVNYDLKTIILYK